MFNPLLDAVSTNNVAALRSNLEKQDLDLFSQTAKTGTTETAIYLLSRHPIATEDHSQHVPRPSPSLNPRQYLMNESARHGNVAVFRYLVSANPLFLTTHNRNIESILINAMDGGIDIWRIILEHDPKWKDYEFSGHRGCVLEIAIDLQKPVILEFLLQQGADTDRAGDPVVELARARKAGPEILDLLRKYST